MDGRVVAHWLFKTEPDEFSIQDLAASPKQTARWDQIRNFQARNFLRDQLETGDQAFIYHSQCTRVGIVGLAEVASPAYPDPSQFDPNSPYFDPKATPGKPRWFAVDIRLVCIFPDVLSLKAIKADERFANMVLLKQGRLSVQPVSLPEATLLLQMAGHTP